MKAILAAILLLGCVLVSVKAQSNPPKFDVATIKQSLPGPATTGFGLITQDAELISYKAISLKFLLMRAYGVKEFQISGPDWMDASRYDLTATLPPGTTADQIPAMLQELINERFRMTVRWDTKQEPVYALVIDKGGPKLKLAADSTQGSEGAKPPASSASATSFQMPGATIAQLTGFLSRVMDRPVIDSTGLQGKFDISLNVSITDIYGTRAQQATEAATQSSPTDADAPRSIFTALREIGLRLNSQKTDIKVLTVVNADRVPTEN